MHSDLNDLVIYEHPGGVRRYYLNALHEVFEFWTVRKAFYINGFNVFALDGTPAFKIDGNWLMPYDLAHPMPRLYFTKNYEPLHQQDLERAQERERRIETVQWHLRQGWRDEYHKK